MFVSPCYQVLSTPYMKNVPPQFERRQVGPKANYFLIFQEAHYIVHTSFILLKNLGY